tara:strand:- start:201 stop:860 length:660 start_codon:yes stop_codon:yes gene_type:complete
MFEWLKEANSPYFWLLPFISAFIGGISSLIFAPVLARINQQVSLSSRAWGRIQDRRIDAYEAILEVGNSLKETRPTGKYNDGHVETFWIHMETPEAFLAWREWFNEKHLVWENWVDLPTSQHMKYLVDYLENLRNAIIQTPEDKLHLLAVTVKDDLITLASETIGVAHSYFENIDKKNFKLRGNGKYPIKKTVRKLKKTKLMPWLVKNGQLAYDYKPRP